MPRPKKTAPNRGKMYEAKVIIGRDIDGKAIRKSFYADVIKHLRVKPNRETVNFIEQFFRDKN